MAAMSDYLEAELLDHVLGKTTRNWTPPANLYIALFTADPTDAYVVANEVPNAYAYARTAVSFDVASSPGGTTQNTAEVAFPAASGGSWGTVTHMGVVDSATFQGGNLLLHGALTTSKLVNNGDQLKFAVGDIDITFA